MTGTRSQSNRGGRCPMCERFIGPVDTCPFCDAPACRPLSLRVLRYAALALALIGLGLLYLMAVRGEPPVIRTADIKPAMNSAFVRVVGTVPANARVTVKYGKADYVSFRIDDGSGTINAGAAGSCAVKLVEQWLVPVAGDRVDVTGEVNIRQGKTGRIIIDAPGHLVILARSAAGTNGTAGAPGATH